MRVVSVDNRGLWDVVGFTARLWKVVRDLRPQVIHGYMYGANEIALLLGRAVLAGAGDLGSACLGPRHASLRSRDAAAVPHGCLASWRESIEKLCVATDVGVPGRSWETPAKSSRPRSPQHSLPLGARCWT